MHGEPLKQSASPEGRGGLHFYRSLVDSLGSATPPWLMDTINALMHSSNKSFQGRGASGSAPKYALYVFCQRTPPRCSCTSYECHSTRSLETRLHVRSKAPPLRSLIRWPRPLPLDQEGSGRLRLWRIRSHASLLPQYRPYRPPTVHMFFNHLTNLAGVSSLAALLFMRCSSYVVCFF